MMSYLIKILSLLIGFTFILSPININAQINDHKLFVYGKVLQDEKSDIIIFREVDNEWKIIRTMKSRTRYNFVLNLEHKHYVVFQRRDGLIKALYIDQNKTGKWKMKFDIVFSSFPEKEINLQDLISVK
tara:strand:+ start:1451 stop:1837 length:387 start_codon:yes stop_codon:yes gene_type:complete